MNITDVSNSLNLGNNVQKQNTSGKVAGDSFENILKNAISDVNQSQVQAYDAMEGIATGKVKNLQEAVQKIEEAELSLRLSLEVKNKAISAYKEVMRIQV
ncbi:flagellar hook-basal body complex protein FliE [Candidatus Marinarcus aquaticus]|uniref:Flagellar hook-basal body complex protein FliE n=1 Tax=Candidatus Marinarcus aquaticus TaxID=2044504 RepID=A0A4Q0XP45_9BACT|nr:flagellar hook-basal body complex protein FliE [Candidatus Marinarcus aquaticus]RXJ56266.1 flagellar hook-basal body complex protein FliE [Candidatus Marinarcus aquaticus]